MKFKQKILLALTASLLTFSFMSVKTFAVISCSSPNLSVHDAIACGECGAAGQPSCTPSDGSSLNTTIRSIINILSVVVGIVAVVMIIIAGLRYITSAGNPESAKGARNTILYAIIGLIIVAMAQIIVHFVLTTASGTNNGSNTSTGSPGTPSNPAGGHGATAP